MSHRTLKYTAGIVLIIVAMLGAAGCTSVAKGEGVKDTINQTLIGQNITYYSVAGEPMNYTIAADDIASIEPTTYKENAAWKVHVGTSLTWNFTMSADGTEILETEQLFRT